MYSFIYCIYSIEPEGIEFRNQIYYSGTSRAAQNLESDDRVPLAPAVVQVSCGLVLQKDFPYCGEHEMIGSKWDDIP